MTHSLTRRAALACALPGVAACASRSGDAAQASFWYSYGGKNREVLERLLRRFHDETPDCRIDATFQGDYFECLAKLRTALAARAAPALSHVVGEVIPYLSEAGVLEPLDAYEGAGDLDLLPGLAQEGSFEAGGTRPLVAVPFNRSTPIMYVNRDMLARQALTIPRDWNELREAARALTRRRAGGVEVWGFETPVASWFWSAMVFSAGGRLTDQRGAFTFGGDAGVRALGLWQTLVHRDRVMRPPLGRDYNAWQVGMQDFLSERTAMLWSSTAFLRYVEENARFAVDVASLPAERGGERARVPTGGTFFVILRAAPAAQKLAAWRFVRWMTQAQQTIAWSTSTGYMPVTRPAVTQLTRAGHYDAHPHDRVALAELDAIAPWPWSPTLFRAQREIVDPCLEDAVLQGRDAAQTLTRALLEASEP
jgi:sn-glycerol 3-phosphate transport system substrate-binding protein